MFLLRYLKSLGKTPLFFALLRSHRYLSVLILLPRLFSSSALYYMKSGEVGRMSHLRYCYVSTSGTVTCLGCIGDQPEVSAVGARNNADNGLSNPLCFHAHAQRIPNGTAGPLSRRRSGTWRFALGPPLLLSRTAETLASMPAKVG